MVKARTLEEYTGWLDPDYQFLPKATRAENWIDPRLSREQVAKVIDTLLPPPEGRKAARAGAGKSLEQMRGMVNDKLQAAGERPILGTITVYDWERGKSNPRAWRLQAYVDVVNEMLANPVADRAVAN